MEIKDLDITETIREYLPVKSFIFNPSIAHIVKDKYLLSVRSIVTDYQKPYIPNPILSQNPQHPWGAGWDQANHDSTYIFPAKVSSKSIKILKKSNSKWPIEFPHQDTRLFRFTEQGNKVYYIVTYNQAFTELPELIIKGGDRCDDNCYIIGWSYLIVDKQSLNYEMLPSETPLCANISQPVEKNWSLWTYKHDGLTELMVSYALTPIHTAFSFELTGVDKYNGTIEASSKCSMVTPRPDIKNLLGQLEEYYGKKLHVSLSSPSYKVSGDTYQAVGHMKITHDYLKDLVKSRKRNPLAAFAKKYMKKKASDIHYHHKYIYLMFLYRFKMVPASTVELPVGSGLIELSDTTTRMKAVVTHVTPAFTYKVTEQDYFLNFPSGMVLTKNHTVVSYGNGDYSAHLLFMSNDTVDTLMLPVTEVTPDSYLFFHGVKDMETGDVN